MSAQEFLAIRLRLRLNLTQLAEQLGVDVRTVRRWHNGEIDVPPPIALLMRLLDPGSRRAA